MADNYHLQGTVVILHALVLLSLCGMLLLSVEVGNFPLLGLRPITLSGRLLAGGPLLACLNNTSTKQSSQPPHMYSFRPPLHVQQMIDRSQQMGDQKEVFKLARPYIDELYWKGNGFCGSD